MHLHRVHWDFMLVLWVGYHQRSLLSVHWVHCHLCGQSNVSLDNMLVCLCQWCCYKDLSYSQHGWWLYHYKLPILDPSWQHTSHRWESCLVVQEVQTSRHLDRPALNRRETLRWGYTAESIEATRYICITINSRILTWPNHRYLRMHQLHHRTKQHSQQVSHFKTRL